MSIVHAQSTIGALGANIIFTVALGGNQNRSSFGITESSAGWRLKFNAGSDGPSQMAQSGDNPIAEPDWAQDRTIITPPGFQAGLFEFKWDEVSKDPGFTSTTSPAAEGVFAVWNGDEQWIARRVGTSASINWVIDITVREIANPANTDTIRVTLSCEVNT